MNPVAILSAGMVTGVGLDAASSCAAIRCAIDNFSETRFIDRGGEWIIGSQVPLEQGWRGLAKLVHMVAPPIRECLAHTGSTAPHQIPFCCVLPKMNVQEGWKAWTPNSLMMCRPNCVCVSTPTRILSRVAGWREHWRLSKP